jgi:hypothetical protein
MTARFMPGVAHMSEFPAGWEQVSGVAYCLSCSRRRAGEAKVAALSDDDTRADHQRADAEGRIEFELSRSPVRADSRIARACGTNIIMVRGVRQRLRAYPTRPV